MLTDPLILSIDTSAMLGGVGLASADRPIGAVTLGSAGSQAETILLAIESLMAEAGRTPTEIGLIAVALGPGSFAGLRIGLAAANGIGFGRGIPVVGIPTTTIRMAWARLVSESLGSTWGAVLDARRGDVFLATGRSAASDPLDIEVISGPNLAPAADAAAWLAPLLDLATPSRPLVLCGEGVPVIAGSLINAISTASPAGTFTGMNGLRTVSPPRPADAVRLLSSLGWRQFLREGAPPLLEPLYVRPPDARKPARPVTPPAAPGGGRP